MNIEIDITLRCNLSCLNCNRHCNMGDLGIEYSNSDMTIEQIYKFISQVKNGPTLVENVRLTGGEPLLHPQVIKISRLLKEELLDQKRIKSLEILTNTTLKVPEEILNMKDIRVFNYIPPDKKKVRHRCMFVAPKDTGQMKTKCNMPWRAGIVLSKYGYTPCGGGSAIVRLFGFFDLIKYELPRGENDFGDKTKLCELCQVCAVNEIKESEYGRLISPSFENALKKIDAKYFRNFPIF